MTGPRVAVVIPTRNRADLVPAALGSVVSRPPKGVEVVVSDNSTDPDQCERTRNACDQYAPELVRYVRPPEPLDMGTHWQWALDSALSCGDASHVLYLTDRMVFRPAALADVVRLVEKHPDR